jgi:hypothetical protein
MNRDPDTHHAGLGTGIGLLLLLAASTSLQAQTVHRCTRSDGHVAFQQVPCPASQAGEVVEIPPHVVLQPEPQQPVSGTAKPRTANAVHRRATKEPAPVYSFECRTASGALFYRHGSCPRRVPAMAGRSPASQSTVPTEPVSARRVLRAEACRGLRSAARDGREHDEQISTYDRNLGRDPCRRY